MRRIQSLSPSAVAFAAAAILAVGGCSHDSKSSVTEPTGTDTSKSSAGVVIAIDSEVTGQTAVVGTAVPVRVHVTESGAPIPNTTVQWSVTGGNGKLSSASSVTDASGLAQVQWTLGDTAGTNAMTASITGAQVTIEATGTAAAPSAIAKVSADSQTVVPGGTVPLTARTVDRFGNPAGGVTVQWSTSGGTLSATSTLTGSSGNATTNLTTPAAAGRYQVTATFPGLGSVTFVVIAQ